MSVHGCLIKLGTKIEIIYTIQMGQIDLHTQNDANKVNNTKNKKQFHKDDIATIEQ